MNKLNQNESGQPNKNGEKSLEPHSQINDSLESKQVLEGQLRECFGRVVYSHKTHEKQADILVKRLSCIKLGHIILSAIIAGSFLVRLFGLGEIGSIIGAIVSAVLLGLTLYAKDSNLAELAQKHKQAANEIWLIREKYQSLITDLAVGEKRLDVIQQGRDNLMEELHLVYSNVPGTDSKAYAKAQKALKQNEDMTFSEKEIDDFLPKELKRGQ